MVWCKHPFSEKKKNLKTERKKIAKKFFEERKCVKCKCCVDLSRISYFMSCVMVYDVVWFDLRHFLGFLAVFCALCGKLSRLCCKNGLEWLKMRYCVPEHPNKHAQTVLFWHFGRNKRKSGLRKCLFCESYARARVCIINILI